MAEKLQRPLAPELTPTISTVMRLRPGVCRWPIGHPKEPAFGFCGRPSGVSIYCIHHQGLAYRARVVVVNGQQIRDSWL